MKLFRLKLQSAVSSLKLMLARLTRFSSVLSHRYMSVSAHQIAAICPSIRDYFCRTFSDSGASWPGWHHTPRQSQVCNDHKALGGVRTSSRTFRKVPRHHGRQHCTSATRGSHPYVLNSTRETGQLSSIEVISDLTFLPLARLRLFLFCFVTFGWNNHIVNFLVTFRYGPCYEITLIFLLYGHACHLNTISLLTLLTYNT